MNFKPIENEEPVYWYGKENIFIRLITYAKVGVNQINDYKYIGAAIFGIYYTLKLSNAWWLLLMGAVSLPIVILLGRWWLYKGAKSSEFVITQKGTVLGFNIYNANVKTVELLEEINKKLEK